MKKVIASAILMSLLLSCVEPEKADNISKGSNKSSSVTLKTSQTSSNLAIKNFLQVNNTYSKLTGISPNRGDILDEYRAIQLQLPSSTDPKTLNGFNQIAATRLAFAYCDEYVDENESDFDFSSASTNRLEVQNLSLKFGDFDFDQNQDHINFLNNLEAIINDEDELVDDGNFAREKRKLMKMSCSAVLSSTYITMF
ncbi:MAG: hypothetical protein CME65_12130 [Halobacteriovoraceae bacterium]|nr:hypothetical protein [Halobacteriovoraceae bacterium]|tara:strand:+ start:11968 stop:12558 length:591 start_codon:yes stop_codon:yes gene_type:complete